MDVFFGWCEICKTVQLKNRSYLKNLTRYRKNSVKVYLSRKISFIPILILKIESKTQLFLTHLQDNRIIRNKQTSWWIQSGWKHQANGHAWQELERNGGKNVLNVTFGAIWKRKMNLIYISTGWKLFSQPNKNSTHIFQFCHVTIARHLELY